MQQGVYTRLLFYPLRSDPSWDVVVFSYSKKSKSDCKAVVLSSVSHYLLQTKFLEVLHCSPEAVSIDWTLV